MSNQDFVDIFTPGDDILITYIDGHTQYVKLVGWRPLGIIVEYNGGNHFVMNHAIAVISETWES